MPPVTVSITATLCLILLMGHKDLKAIASRPNGPSVFSSLLIDKGQCLLTCCGPHGPKTLLRGQMGPFCANKHNLWRGHSGQGEAPVLGGPVATEDTCSAETQGPNGQRRGKGLIMGGRVGR